MERACVAVRRYKYNHGRVKAGNYKRPLPAYVRLMSMTSGFIESDPALMEAGMPLYVTK